MAHKFSTDTLRLTRQTVTATGNNLYVNGLLVGSGLYATVVGLTESGIQLGSKIDLLSGYGENFFVHRLGDEAITGIKSFATTGINVHGNPFLTGLIPGTNITVQNNGNGTFTINSTAEGGTGTADLTNVVFTSGEQIISGVKFFNTGVVISGNLQQGSGTLAQGAYSASFGELVSAYGIAAFAHGRSGAAFGDYSHVEGVLTSGIGTGSHAEGLQTIAIGRFSHAEGSLSVSSGFASHAEGTSSTFGTASHAEGESTISIGNYSHSEGQNTTGHGINSHSEGERTLASGSFSHAEGRATYAVGQNSHAEGNATRAFGAYAHSEGWQTYATGTATHTEGIKTQATGNAAHAEGFATTANGSGSHSEGDRTLTLGFHAHAEGSQTTASGVASHAEGLSSISYGNYSHAQGRSTAARGLYSHAEGFVTVSEGDYSHSEGQNTTGNGTHSHAEGFHSNAYGINSHAEGAMSASSGNYSHAEGSGTATDRSFAHAQGFNNRVGVSGLFQVGRGTPSEKSDVIYVSDTNSNPSILSGNWLTETGFLIAGRRPITGAYGATVNNDGTLTITAGGGAPQDVVYTSGDQAITGIKTFVTTGINILGEPILTGIIGGINITVQDNNNGTFTVNASSIDGSVISGNLTQSGVQLGSKIDSLSGYGENFFVHRIGDESITGIKTFVTTGLNVMGEIVLTGIVAGTNITIQDNNNGTFTLSATSAPGGDAITGIRVTGSNSIIGEFNIIKSGDGINVTLSGDRTLVISSPAVASLGTVFVSDLLGTDSRGASSPYDPNVPFKTIAAAENAALDFDTIYIYSGIYTGANLGKNNIDYYFSPNSFVTGTATIFSDAGSAKNIKILGEGNFFTTATQLVNFTNSESNLRYDFKNHSRGDLVFGGDRIYVNGEHFGGDPTSANDIQCNRTSAKTGSFVNINIKTVLNAGAYFEHQKVKFDCVVFSGLTPASSTIGCVGNKTVVDFNANTIGNVIFNSESAALLKAQAQEAFNIRFGAFNAGQVDYRFGLVENTSVIPYMDLPYGYIRIDRFFSQREPYINADSSAGRHLEVDIGYYSGVRFQITNSGPSPTTSNASFLTLKGNYVITGTDTAFYYNPSSPISGNLTLDNVSILTNAITAFSGNNGLETGLLNVKGTLLTNKPLLTYVLKRGIIEIDPDLTAL